jgi:Rps23 Pro-64 3,4-dihydroxylase Tpa1-like proline 4-hydroxylase
MKVKDYILTFDNVMKENLLFNFNYYCKNIKYDEAKIVGNKTIGSNDKKIRNTDIHDLNTREAAPDIIYLSGVQKSFTKIHWNNILKNMIMLSAQRYQMDLKIPYSPISEVEDVTILRYLEGGHYILHTDYATKFKRCLSFIFFVNDDYEGGELCFADPDYTNETIIKPKKNRVVIFPSNFMYPHKVNSVTKGIRYSVVSWLV